MQVSNESSAVEDEIMSEQSLVAPPSTTRKTVVGRARGLAPSSLLSTSNLANTEAAGARIGAVASTASTFKGPGRFITRNMEDGRRGSKEVARQSRLLKSKLRTGSVPTKLSNQASSRHMGLLTSPRGAGKGNRGSRPHSSSPARPGPQRAPAAPRTPLVERLFRVPPAKKSSIDRGENEKKKNNKKNKKRAQVTERSKPNKSRVQPNQESDFDLGFGPPPTRAAAVPSVTSAAPAESVEKAASEPSMPPAPARWKGKIKAALTSAGPEISSQASVLTKDKNYIDLWMPRIKGDQLYIEGNKLDSTSCVYSEETWCTSKIVARISERMVATKKGTVYTLEGTLRVRPRDHSESVPTPEFILDNFARGIPENWEQLMSSWSAWIQRQQDSNFLGRAARSTEIIFNSTRLLQTPSHPGQPTSGRANLSAMEASRFLQANETTVGLGSVTCLTGPKCNTVMVAPSGVNIVRPQLDTIWEESSSQKSSVSRERPSSLSIPTKCTSMSPERSLEPPARKDSSDESPTKQVEHRSRSKNICSNFNLEHHENTMSQQEITQLRARDYKDVTIFNKKRNYNCTLCDFITPLLVTLKKHIKDNHMVDGPEPVPTPKKPSQRSHSDDTVLDASTPDRAAVKKSRRSRCRSTSKVQEKIPDMEGVVISGSQFKCQLCNSTFSKSNLAPHVNTKKHLKNLPSMRKFTISSLKSPKKFRKTRRSQTPPISSKNPPQSIQSRPASSNSMSASSMSVSASPKYMNTNRAPGLGLFNCFACNFSADFESAMRAHIVNPVHGRKVKEMLGFTMDEERAANRYLHCNVCKFNGSSRKEFIKHLQSQNHIKKVDDPACKERDADQDVAKSSAKTPFTGQVSNHQDVLHCAGK
jgi:hypothetical protein